MFIQFLWVQVFIEERVFDDLGEFVKEHGGRVLAGDASAESGEAHGEACLYEIGCNDDGAAFQYFLSWFFDTDIAAVAGAAVSFGIFVCGVVDVSGEEIA